MVATWMACTRRAMYDGAGTSASIAARPTNALASQFSMSATRTRAHASRTSSRESSTETTWTARSRAGPRPLPALSISQAGPGRDNAGREKAGPSMRKYRAPLIAARSAVTCVVSAPAPAPAAEIRSARSNTSCTQRINLRAPPQTCAREGVHAHLGDDRLGADVRARVEEHVILVRERAEHGAEEDPRDLPTFQFRPAWDNTCSSRSLPRPIRGRTRPLRRSRGTCANHERVQGLAWRRGPQESVDPQRAQEARDDLDDREERHDGKLAS
jgi:hypothetical protein